MAHCTQCSYNNAAKMTLTFVVLVSLLAIVFVQAHDNEYVAENYQRKVDYKQPAWRTSFRKKLLEIGNSQNEILNRTTDIRNTIVTDQSNLRSPGQLSELLKVNREMLKSVSRLVHAINAMSSSTHESMDDIVEALSKTNVEDAVEDSLVPALQTIIEILMQQNSSEFQSTVLDLLAMIVSEEDEGDGFDGYDGLDETDY